MLDPLITYEGEQHDGLYESDMFDYRRSFLHKYMCSVFQYIDKTNPKMTKRKYIIFKIIQLLFIILIWSCFAYKLLIFTASYDQETRDLNTFKTMVLVVINVIWMLRYVILHNMGLYVLSKRPNEAMCLTEILINNTKTSQQMSELKARIKKRNRDLLWIILSTWVCLIIFPAIRRITPMALEIKQGYYQGTGILFMELAVLSCTRLTSLPCLFYIIYVASLQRLRIKQYYQKLQLSAESLDDLFQEYVDIHRKIEKFAKSIQTYMSMLIVLLFMWGSLTIFNTIGIIRHISYKEYENSIDYKLEVFETFANFVVFTVEIVLLFSLPWYYLNEVASDKQKLISRVWEIEFSKNKASDTFDSFEDIHQLAKRIEKHQKYEDLGYRAFGVNVTTIRIVWISLLAPGFLFLASAVMKGKM